MQYTSYYLSKIGNIFLASDEEGLTGLWFEGEKYFADNLAPNHEEKETEIIKLTKKWLDIYFSGKNPDYLPPLHPIGTDFRQRVWSILLEIPYGETVTYNDIAKKIAKEKGIQKMSAQAVGGAVGHNEISIIIPCHRVVGTNGNLTGYAGGIDKKLQLLEIEGCNVNKLSLPKSIK